MLALAATVPGSANASFGTLSYRVHGPVDARVDGETTVTASCRPGSYVLGGGQYIRAGDQDAIVHSSAPFDGPDADTTPDDGWRSRVDSFNGAQNTVTEYAICSTKQPRYRVHGSAVGNGPYYANPRTMCPRGDTVLGGGIDIGPGYDSAWILQSAPGPTNLSGSVARVWDGWALVGVATVPDQRIADWAICGRAEVTYPRVTGVVAQGGSGKASAPCPAATRLVGGGVRVPVPKFATPDVRPTTFSPVDGRDGDLVPDDRWRIEADDWDGRIGEQTIEATAICLQ